MFNFTIYTGLADQQVQLLLDRLDRMQKELTKLMAELQTSLDGIDKVTNAMAATLVEEGKTLQQISDEQDALLAAVKNGTVTTAQLEQAAKSADALAAVGANLASIADISKGIALKGQPVIPPTPVPGPTPAPAPLLP